jgi:hypothetical protein
MAPLRQPANPVFKPNPRGCTQISVGCRRQRLCLLEKSTSLYGGLGVVATLLFFMYVVGRIVVTAPILNSSLHEELRGRSPHEDGEMPVSPATD